MCAVQRSPLPQGNTETHGTSRGQSSKHAAKGGGLGGARCRWAWHSLSSHVPVLLKLKPQKHTSGPFPDCRPTRQLGRSQPGVWPCTCCCPVIEEVLPQISLPRRLGEGRESRQQALIQGAGARESWQPQGTELVPTRGEGSAGSAWVQHPLGVHSMLGAEGWGPGRLAL